MGIALFKTIPSIAGLLNSDDFLHFRNLLFKNPLDAHPERHL